MGIRFFCPNGHKLNVKAFQAGQRGICPVCGTKVQIPLESTRPGSSRRKTKGDRAGTGYDQRLAGAELEAASFPSPPVSMAAPDPPGQELPSVDKTPNHIAAPSTPATEPHSGHGAAQPAAAPSPLFLNHGEPTAAKVASFGTDTGVSPADPAPPATDPLSDSADLVWYVRPPSGGQYGPATSPIMRAWISEGRVPPDALVWREGWRDWRQASTVFSHLRTDEETELLEAISQKSPSLPHGRAAIAPGSARSRDKSTYTAVIALLIVAAILVLAVLLWVVFKGPRFSSTASFAPVPAGVAAGALGRPINFGNHKPRCEQR